MIWINLAVIGCAPAPVTPSGPPPPDIRLFVPGVVAASDLPAGRVVGPGDLVVGAVPSFVVSQVDDPAALVGYTVREPVLAGEPIRTERLVAPTDGREGYDALVEPGRAAVLLPVPTFALSGVEPGCRVEVLAVTDGRSRPRRATPGAVRVVGVDAGVVIVDAPGPILAADDPARTTIVLVPPAVGGAANAGDVGFVPPERPGMPIAVARRTLGAGVMIRDDDLAEVGGIGLVALRIPNAWARVPHQPIYPGEPPRPERIVTPSSGTCYKIPNGLRGVAVPAEPGTVSADWAESYVRLQVRGNALGHLYVVAVDLDASVVTLATLPDTASAIASAAAAVSTPFAVDADSPR